MCQVGSILKRAGSFRLDESGISPVIGTILLVALSTVVVTTGAAVSTGVVDLPDPAPSGDMQVSDAPGTLSSSADTLFWLKHRGGDALTIEDLEVVVENEDGDTLTYGDGELELSELGESDGTWDMGETLVISEVECATESSDNSDGNYSDHDKGHGNDPDGYDKDNPGNSNGVNGNSDDCCCDESDDNSSDDDGNNGHGNDADVYDESNPGNSDGANGNGNGNGNNGNGANGNDNDDGGDDCNCDCDTNTDCPDFISSSGELTFKVIHVPTGELVMEGGVNVE